MLRMGFGSGGGHDQALCQTSQIEAAIESVGEPGEGAMSVLGEGKGVIGPGEGGLQVAQRGVDGVELRQVLGLELSDHMRLVGALGLGEGGEAVADDFGCGREAALGPIGQAAPNDSGRAT